jgi:hypothetical protein
MSLRPGWWMAFYYGVLFVWWVWISVVTVLWTTSKDQRTKRRPPISGGSHPVPDEATVRARLQMLIEGGVLRRSHPGQLWTGRCRTWHDCTFCGTSIEIGGVELKITLAAGVVMFIHGRCFDLWTEVSGDGDQGQPRGPDVRRLR